MAYLQGMYHHSSPKPPSNPQDLPSGSTPDGAKSYDTVVDETFCAWLVLTDSRGVLEKECGTWMVGVGWELRMVG